MQLHRAAVEIIRQHEGCRLVAYRCPAERWTIGYGHTGPEVSEGLHWSQEQADRQLADDLDRFSAQVDRLLTAPATPEQFGAMVSLAYNIGVGAFGGSSVLRQHNGGNTAAAADAFLLWDKAGGRILPGLVARRQAERDLYLSGCA